MRTSPRSASARRRLEHARAEAVAEQRVRAIRRFYLAWSGGDRGGMLKVADRNVTAEHDFGLPSGRRTYRGHAGIAAMCDQAAAHWDTFRCDVREVSRRGTVLIALVEVRADRTGETFAGRTAVVCAFHGARIISLRPAAAR